MSILIFLRYNTFSNEIKVGPGATVKVPQGLL